MASEESIHKILERLGRAVSRAVSGSDEVSGAVKRIRKRGYALYLVLDSRDEEEEAARGIEIVPRRGVRARLQTADGKPRPAASTRRPSYRLDSDDASFLRSVGIDPSRTGRRGGSAPGRLDERPEEPDDDDGS